MHIVRTANNSIIIPEIDFGRHCVRCGESVHRYANFGGEHLCKDVAQGLADYVRQTNEAAWNAYARDLVVHGGEA